ncbi:MAG: type III polyketide synthase [Rubripirellula sp.]
MTPPTSEARKGKARILGVGTSVPRFHVDHGISAEFAERTSAVDASNSRKVRALYRRSGIEKRGSVLLAQDDGSDVVNLFYPPAESPEDRGPTTKNRSDRYAEEAPVLAEQASLSALKASQLSADDITHLVTVSCTGFGAPGVDIALIDLLGLPITTERVHVGFMGCHGAINGLRVARGLVDANQGARVLLCSVELCSLHYQYGMSTDEIVSNAIFADGSAALLLGDDSPKEDALGSVAATGSCLVPASRDAMTWQIGDNGYEMTLSPKVPDLIQRHLRPFLAEWLAKSGETIESIGGWAVHPGGTRILSAAQNALGLDDGDLAHSRGVLSDHGNMSSATMLFVLERFATVNQPKPWVMLGFGPGLEVEVALIR